MEDPRLLLSKRDILIATLFTQVEVVILTAWLLILGITGTVTQAAEAFMILEVGLETEHLISRLK